jgi:2-methylcitrate dehydratase PrpD
MNDILDKPLRSAHGNTLAPITAAVVDFAAQLDYDSLPVSVVEKAKWHILDTLCCAMAGRGLEVAVSARKAARTMGGGDCPVFGTDLHASASAAAFANAVTANALDYDDGFEIDGKGMGHPGSTIVSAALCALGEQPVSGKAFITAVVAGYEINNRLIYSMQPSAERFAEVYGVSQHQGIGACITYARLRGLPRDALNNAIGLAGGLTPVPSLHKYNWNARPIISLKDFVAPAAMAGVLAVELSQAGFIGSSDLFDGPAGYWRMIGSDRFEPARLIDDLGQRWYLEDSSFKLYPACRWMAPALEAFEQLLAEHAIAFDDIAEVAVDTFSVIRDKLMAVDPINEIDAQFSLPFCLAALAMRLPKGREWFSPTALADPRMKALARRVSVKVDPLMDSHMSGAQRRPSARVSIDLRDGRRVRQTIVSPLGSSSRPVSLAMICAKALHNLQGCSGSAESTVDWLLGLEEHESVNDRLLALMTEPLNHND